jgi:transcriptional regulator with XRE-family HTH domain
MKGCQMSDIIDDDNQSMGADEEQEQLGKRLRESREYIGLSQEFVAERLGIPRASVSAMETGKRKVSGLELKQLARLYRCSIAFLLGEEKQEDVLDSETVRALFRTTKDLSEQARQQVLQFAQFLRQAGPLPTSSDDAKDRNTQE